jgi:DNA polymerase III subunit beta
MKEQKVLFLFMSSDAVAIRCEREALLAAIQAADAVVPTSSAKPICTNLQLAAVNGRLEITATDMQVGLRSIVGRVQVDQTGETIVAARQLGSILKESRSRDVGLSLVRRDDHNHLAIGLSDGDYQVPALVGETFPSVNLFPADAPTVRLSAERCEEMIHQTIFAVDKDRTSAVLSGVYVAVGNGEFIMAATDGKVLCEAVESDAAFASIEPLSVIVPAVTINHLNRILQSTKPETVEIAFAGSVVFFRVVLESHGGLQVELSSRLVEGNFPPYRNALPAPSDNVVVFETSELASAVRRTALMTSNTARGIVMNLENGQAVLSNLNYTNGSAKIPVVCKYDGSSQRLGVNAQYLGEVLKVYKSPSVRVELARGLIMRETGVTYLIMPISLPN